MRPLFYALLMLAAFPGAAQDGFLREFKQKWSNAATYTLELAESMPAEAYSFRPAPAVMTFEEQLLHMARNMNWLSSFYLRGRKTEADLSATGYTKSELIAILRETLELAAEAVANLKPDQLGETMSFFAGPMTRRQILVLMNDHLTHHRGQAVIYLRLQGVQPPAYRGW